MEAVSYTKDNHRYDVIPITDESYINADMQTVATEIQDTDPAAYRANMQLGVQQGLAYSIFRDGIRIGFVYNRIENNRYYGSSIFIDRDLAGMIVAFKSMFEICDKHKIEFVPHTGNLHYFKSMIDGSTLRLFHNGAPTVTIMRDKMIADGYRAFHYLGIQQL